MSYGKDSGMMFAKWHESSPFLHREGYNSELKELAEAGLQANEKYCSKHELKGAAWEAVWHSPRQRLHPCTGNAQSHLWAAPLPRHHPQDGDGGRGMGHLQENIKVSEKCLDLPNTNKHSVSVLL